MSENTFEGLTEDFSEIMKNLNNPEYDKSSLCKEIDNYMNKSLLLGEKLKDKKSTLDLRSGILRNIKSSLVEKMDISDKENIRNISEKKN